jgi:CheY-like chemotaxis protein
VRADPGQVEQIIMNLAVNARDAMPQGGTLTIATSDVELDSGELPRLELDAGRYARLSVTDTGSGIDQAALAHIFEPFFTTKAQGKGTGLGLATVYGIVKQSGGSITVRSAPGRGTTFEIYLPMVESGVAGGQSLSTAEPNLYGAETVLLVEDEPAVRALSRLVLQTHGYTVLEASDGAEALKLSERLEGPIDLLLTDVVMPGIGGRPLAEMLRAARPAVKVLFLSGYTDDAVMRHGISHSEVAFLQKPFTPATLAAKVREALDSAPAPGR